MRAILLDIEGTTTSIDFVYRILFPYARAQVETFLSEHQNNSLVAQSVATLHAEWEQEGQPIPWDAAAYVHYLMDEDRKSTGLKALQGAIWKDGYERGELQGEIYPDVFEAFSSWREHGVAIYIYSSGSILAQKLLFSSTKHGDLTPYISDHFDTTTGPKREADSYKKIATATGIPAEEILFVSDVVEELDAAHAAGLDVCLSIRPGNKPVAAHTYRSVTSFSELL